MQVLILAEGICYMCGNENHKELNQAEHFTRHAMEVERTRAAFRHNAAGISIEAAIEDAIEALRLAPPKTDAECLYALHLAAEGDFRIPSKA